MPNSHKTTVCSCLKSDSFQAWNNHCYEFDIVISSRIYLPDSGMKSLHLLSKLKKKSSSRKQHTLSHSIGRAFSSPKEMKSRWWSAKKQHFLSSSKLIISIVMIIIKYVLCSQRTQLYFGFQHYFVLSIAFWMKHYEYSITFINTLTKIHKCLCCGFFCWSSITLKILPFAS